MDMIPSAFFLYFGQKIILKTQVMNVCPVDCHQDGVKIESFDALFEDKGFVVPCYPQESYHAL